ncbi:hypothetical protein ABIE27_006057 [Paenibacillus sp. 4624]
MYDDRYIFATKLMSRFMKFRDVKFYLRDVRHITTQTVLGKRYYFHMININFPNILYGLTIQKSRGRADGSLKDKIVEFLSLAADGVRDSKHRICRHFIVIVCPVGYKVSAVTSGVH